MKLRLATAVSVVVLLQATLAVGLAPSEYADLPTSQILSQADSLLSKGQGAGALELYDVAVERDRSSYLNLYKRGTARLALGQHKKALEDFEGVLALTEFDQARLQAVRLQLRIGAYDEAMASLDTYLSRNKKDSTAADLKKSAQTAKKALASAEKAKGKKNWDACVNEASQGLEVSSFSVQLLQLRADCQLQLGRIEEGAGDLTRAVSVSPNSPELLARLSLLQALYLNAGPQSLTPLKQCLHFDPESKPCKRLHRSLRKLEKDLSQIRNFVEGGRWHSALGIMVPKGADQKNIVEQVKELIAEHVQAGESIRGDEHSQLVTSLYGWICKAYTATNTPRLAIAFCREVLKRNPESIDGLVGVGEAALRDENYEEAVKLLSQAFEKTGRSDGAVLEKLQKAQRLLKQAKAKDYYKILGVSRDADVATIKKAYRKATLKAHPDKGGSEEKMAAVNEAWEVLGNPELKARFDNGDDPNDPMSGQQGGGGHHPFYGSPGGNMGGQQFFQQFFQHGGGFGGGFPGHGHGGGQQHFKFQWG